MRYFPNQRRWMPRILSFVPEPRGRGAAGAAYTLIAVGVAVVGLGGVIAFSGSVEETFETAETALESGMDGDLVTSRAPRAADSEPEEIIPPELRGVGQQIITVGTEVAPPVFAGTVPGDLHVAFVVHRSTLTAPAEWETVLSRRTSNWDQWLTVLTRVQPDGPAVAPTFTQADDARFLAQVATVEGTRARVAVHTSQAGDAATREIPAHYVAGDHALKFLAMTDVYTDTNDPTTYAIDSNAWSFLSAESAYDNHLALLMRAEGAEAGAAVRPALTMTHDEAPDRWAAALVQITTDGAIEAPQDFDGYGAYADPEMLVLTEQDDTATLDGTHVGVQALAGDDVVDGTSASEQFIGGPGDDTLRGGDGEDTYVYARGDGSDTIEDHHRTPHPDVVHFLDIDSTEVTFHNAGDDDLEMTLPDDNTVRFVNTLQANGDWDIETFRFRDATLDLRAVRDRMVADMAVAQDLAIGTQRDETYRYAVGDGSWELRDYDSNGGNDILSMPTIAPETVTVTNAGNDDVTLTFEDGSVLTMDRFLEGSGDFGVDRILFFDGEWSHKDLRDKLVADMRSTGLTVGSTFDETYTHAPGDGSYTIRDYDRSGGDDRLEITGTDFDAATFARDGNTLVMTLSGGEEIRIHDTLRSDDDWDIETITFNGMAYTDMQIRSKLMEDQKSSGRVVGTANDETYGHTQGDGSYTIEDYDRRGGNDRLDITGTSFADAYFRRTGNDLHIDLNGGETLTIYNTLRADDDWDIETISFEGEEYSEVQIRNRLMADQKSTGSVVGTAWDEHYTHAPGDGSYTLEDYDRRGGDDRLDITGTTLAEASLERDGDDLVIGLNGDETITILGTIAGNDDRNIETISFNGTDYSEQDVRFELMDRMKSTGAVVGTSWDEHYSHAPGDGSYTLEDYNRRGGDDRLDITGTSFSDAAFARSDNDIVLTLSGGETVTIRNMLDPDDDWNIETISFDGVSYSERQIRERVMEDMKSTGRVVGTQLNEHYFYATGDGSYTIEDYDRRTGDDRLMLTDVSIADASARSSGTDLVIDITQPDGSTESITLHRQLDNDEWGMEHVGFTDGAWDSRSAIAGQVGS